jgi:hypothetical protein
MSNNSEPEIETNQSRDHSLEISFITGYTMTMTAKLMYMYHNSIKITQFHLAKDLVPLALIVTLWNYYKYTSIESQEEIIPPHNCGPTNQVLELGVASSACIASDDLDA